MDDDYLRTKLNTILTHFNVCEFIVPNVLRYFFVCYLLCRLQMYATICICFLFVFFIFNVCYFVLFYESTNTQQLLDTFPKHGTNAIRFTIYNLAMFEYSTAIGVITEKFAQKPQFFHIFFCFFLAI